MKFLIISNLYLPDARGGAERVAELQAKGLKDAGHEVVVLTTGGKSGLHDEMSGNIKIYRFLPLNIFWYKNIGNYPFWLRLVWHAIDAINLHSLWVVRKIIDFEKPDKIISHNLKGLGLLSAVALSNEKKRWIHVIHDIQLSVASGQMRFGEEKATQNSLFNKINEWYCRIIFNSPLVIISPSKWLFDFYNNKNFFKNSECAILPNPVELAQDVQKTTSDQLRLLYIGQIEEPKGVNWLVRHIKDLKGDWKLIVVGDGSAMEDMKNIAGDDNRIKILGKKNRDEINEIFSKTDVTIIPSLIYENSPAVVYESLGAGVPVLGARIGGVGELIEENKNGWTFTPADHNDFLEKLVNLDIQKVRGMVEDCRSSVQSRGLNKYIESLLEKIK